MAQERQVVKLRQANGALLDAPIYDTGPRRSNYLAVIDIDPTMPGGLARKFADKGRGECLYLTEKLDLFEAVEFASDYTTTTGTKHRDRWYGVIITKTEDYLLVERCPTGATAVLRSKQARTSIRDKVRALTAEKELLIARAAALQGEISQLTEDEPEMDEVTAERREVLLASLTTAISIASRPKFGASKVVLEGIEALFMQGNLREVYDSLLLYGVREKHPISFWMALGDARAALHGETQEAAIGRGKLVSLITTANIGRGKTRRMVEKAAEDHARGDLNSAYICLRLLHNSRKQEPDWIAALTALPWASEPVEPEPIPEPPVVPN